MFKMTHFTPFWAVKEFSSIDWLRNFNVFIEPSFHEKNQKKKRRGRAEFMGPSSRARGSNSTASNNAH